MHAQPVENDALQQYQGMPLFAEIGPLKLDPVMQSTAESVCSQILNYEA